MPDVNDIIKTLKSLIDAVADDNKAHGGLVTRRTIRVMDECRLILSRYEAENVNNQQSERTPDGV